MPPEPEPLLPHPAASTPTAASATSATSGRRSVPTSWEADCWCHSRRARGFLLRWRSARALWRTSCCGDRCRADLPPTMTPRRPGVVVASTKGRLLACRDPALPASSNDAGTAAPTTSRDSTATGMPAGWDLGRWPEVLSVTAVQRPSRPDLRAATAAAVLAPVGPAQDRRTSSTLTPREHGRGPNIRRWERPLRSLPTRGPQQQRRREGRRLPGPDAGSAVDRCSPHFPCAMAKAGSLSRSVCWC